MLLTDDEYARSTEKKQASDEQHVDQPDDVTKKVVAIRDGGPTKAMLEVNALRG